MKSYKFIAVSYLWSHGVDVKGHSGLEPADPTTTPMFFHATPGLRTAALVVPYARCPGLRRAVPPSENTGTGRHWAAQALAQAQGTIGSAADAGQSPARVFRWQCEV